MHYKRNVKIGLATGREITEAEKTKGMFWTLGFEFDFIIGMNGGMIYDRNLNKSFTMDMLSVKEMKEILTFLMPIIEENKVSVNVEGNQLHNVPIIWTIDFLLFALLFLYHFLV